MVRNDVKGKRFVFIVCKYHGSSFLYLPVNRRVPFEGRDLHVGLTQFMRKGEFHN